MLEVGCFSGSQGDRPSMSEVLELLSRCLREAQATVPPTATAFALRDNRATTASVDNTVTGGTGATISQGDEVTVLPAPLPSVAGFAETEVDDADATLLPPPSPAAGFVATEVGALASENTTFRGGEETRLG